MARLWCVVESVYGSDRKVRHYFSNKKEADSYYCLHDYVDLPILVKVTEARYDALLEQEKLMKEGLW